MTFFMRGASRWLVFDMGAAVDAWNARHPDNPVGVVRIQSFIEETSEPKPTTSWTKAEVKRWLKDNGVDLTPPAMANLTKVELLAMADDVSDSDLITN